MQLYFGLKSYAFFFTPLFATIEFYVVWDFYLVVVVDACYIVVA